MRAAHREHPMPQPRFFMIPDIPIRQKGGLRMPARSSPDSEAMLTGSVPRAVLRLALPGLAAMLFSSFCTLLDVLLLARHSPQAAAAAALCFPLLTAQQAVGFTLGMGAGSHISRAIGSGDLQSARHAAATALFLSLLLGTLLCTGLFALAPLLLWLGADADTLPAALPYARLLLLASPFSCGSLVMGSLLRAQGRAVANLLAYAVSGMLGAALDLWLIPGLGAQGAGVSVLSREAAAFLLFAALTYIRPGSVRPMPRDITLQPWVFAAILRSGLPTLLRQLCASLAAVLTSRACRAFGPDALAGVGLAMRAQTLVFSAVIGFGQGFSPLCGVCFGAGRMDRVREAYRFCMRVLIAALSVAGAAALLFAPAFLAFFRPEGPTAAIASAALRAQGLAFAFQGAVVLMNMLAQSMGCMVRASLTAVSRQGIFLLPLLLTAPRLFGLYGLILCPAAADVLSCLFCYAVTRPLPARPGGVDKAPAPGLQ